jgi:hypothetical protein
MKDERMEILRMVAEKIISVEEGERLLRALDKGQEESRERRFERCGPRQHRHGDWNLGERMGEMGFRMQEFFDNAFGSVFGDEYWFEGYEAVKGRAEDINVDADTTLVISNPRHVYRSGAGDITLSPSADDRLHVLAKERDRFEILRKDKKILILCQEDTAVQVPGKLSKIKLILAKGHTKINGLDSPLEIRLMKGDISVRGAGQPVAIRSMAGDINLDLADSYSGKTEVAAMHGNIDITTGPDFAGKVEARTTHGDIRIQAKSVKSSASKNAFFRAESIRIGEGDGENQLNLKTMNGNITVRAREAGS